MYNNIPLFEVTANLKKHIQINYKSVLDENISDSVILIGKVTYKLEKAYSFEKDIILEADALKLIGNNCERIIATYNLGGITEDNEEISLHFSDYGDYHSLDYTVDTYIRTVRFSKETLDKTYDVEEEIRTYEATKKLHKKSKTAL